MTQLEIVNLTLSVMGVDPLNSLLDDSKIAKFVNVIYPQAKKFCLSKHFWNFALRQTTLPLLSESDPFWDYVYSLPSDLLQIYKVRDADNEKVEYEERNGKIYSNANPLYLVYVSSEVDEGVFPIYFVEVLKYKLACDLAVPVLRDPKFYSAYYQLYERALADAKRLDSIRGKPSFEYQSEWLAGL